VEGVYVRDVLRDRVATGPYPEPVVGPRGNAIRVNSWNWYNTGYCCLDVPNIDSILGINSSRPFTLALWVRTETGKPLPTNILRARSGTEGVEHRSLQLGFNEDGNLSFAAREQFNRTFRPNSKDSAAEGTRPGVKPGEWFHLAITRDAKGAYRWAVNGEVQAVPGSCEASIYFLHLAIGFEEKGQERAKAFTLEIDEFCIFDRELTGDELTALAGRKALPKK
jgi:hypothetical protein